MYVGRFVVVTPEMAGYRVSSRSFPNRQVTARDGTLTVAPTSDAPETDNPYVSYNCLRTTTDGTYAVVGNGSHVDPITEKLETGYPARDALATALLSLDYEKDDYDTPRIAATIGTDDSSYVGIVRRDGLLVHAIDEPTIVATYEKDSPESIDVESTDVDELVRELYEFDLEHPVCSAGVELTAEGFETAFYNGP